MPPRRRAHGSLPLALTGSCALHAGVILALAGQPMAGSWRGGEAVVNRERQPPPPLPPPPAEQELHLGMDAAPALPTDTWLGFEDYEAQIAPRAEFEQAAFLPDDAATRAAAAAIMTNGAAPPAASFTSAREAFERTVAALQMDQMPQTAVAGAAADRTNSEPADRADTSEPSQPGDVAADAAEPNTPAGEGEPDVAGETVSAGALSDRESEPTSIIDAPPETWRLGRPLAAHGLELKPRRPQFTELTLLTAWPRDPLVSIAFDRDGKPIRAAIEEKTGDKRVDEAILASLYRWRAAGAPLRALPDGETIEVRIRLVLNGQ